MSGVSSNICRISWACLSTVDGPCGSRRIGESMGDRMGLVENKGERLDQRLVKGKTLVVMWEKDEGFPFVWSVTTVKVIIIA